MNPTESRFHEVVQRALNFMRGRQSTKTTVQDVAAFVAYSPSRLRHIFKTVTGKCVRANLHELRLENAGNLLRQTAMNISEVAFASGFDNSSSFARHFRKATGTSPRLFRKATPTSPGQVSGPPYAGVTRDAKLVLSDDFSAETLGVWWNPRSGKWFQSEGCLQGERELNVLAIGLTHNLPENFRLEFDIEIGRVPLDRPTGFNLILAPEQGAPSYCEVIVDHPANHSGVLSIRKRVMLRNPEAVIEPGRWRSVRADLNDNQITVSLDGKNVFTFRELFQPPYPERARLSFFSFAHVIRLRRFRLRDLGFPPVTLELRQGDALYNSGLWRQANDFYLRHLRPGLPAEQEIELRFKIGLCQLRQKRFEPCREWIASIRSLTQDPHWHRECELIFLRLDFETGSLDDFERRAKTALADPSLRNGLRPLASECFESLRSAGFLDRALRIASLQVAIEQDDSGNRGLAKIKLASIRKNTGRLPEAERLLRPLTRPSVPGFLRMAALFSLIDISLLRKRISEARALLSQAGELAESPVDSALCETYTALCLRAERRFAEAVEALLNIRAAQPAAVVQIHAAETRAAEVLYCLGEQAQGDKIVRRLHKEIPSGESQGSARFRDLTLVSHLQRERYAELAHLLRQKTANDDRQLFLRGQRLVTAGILFELAGKADKARVLWLEIARRFPPERCYFWGTLAKDLAAGRPDRLAPAHIFSTVQSELAYLLGRLYEHRGDLERSRQSFELSLKKDPTLRWPALLAGRKLAAARAARLAVGR